MKYSLAVVAASALLASASPLAKRVQVTDFVYEVVTVTVTASESIPTITSTPVVEKPKTTQPPPPPPPPPAAAASVKKPVAKPEPKPAPKIEVQPAPAPAPAPAPKPAPAPAPQPAPSQPSDQPTGGDYASVVLHQHNVHRFNHSAPALAWDDTLAGYAQTIASKCVFAHDMNQGNGGYGQNLASQGTTGDVGDASHGAAVGITNQWYNSEMGNWQFYGQDNAPSDVSLDAYGHFTQLVWKNTHKVGCATVNCPSGTIFGGFASSFTVCNYSPPGNFGGEYGSNVLQPLGQSVLTV